jgi:hypothetical protein
MILKNTIGSNPFLSAKEKAPKPPRGLYCFDSLPRTIITRRIAIRIKNKIYSV